MKSQNRKYKKAFVVILTAFLFVGCAVSAVSKKSFSATSENGLLVGSITFPEVKHHYARYFVRATDNATPEFEIDRTVRGQLDGGRTYLFAVERPEGKAEISSFRFFDSGLLIAGMMDVYFGGFSIPYEIKKGKITYIGNIICNDYAKGNDTLVSLQNHFERDISALKEVKESSEWEEVLNDPSRKIEYTQRKAKKRR